jgi:hypothetical protein
MGTLQCSLVQHNVYMEKNDLAKMQSKHKRKRKLYRTLRTSQSNIIKQEMSNITK